MNRETRGEGGSLYGMVPMELEPAEIERKPHEIGNVVTVLVDNGTSSHFFDDIIIPISNIVYRTTPPSVRLARYLRLELCWVAQRRVPYKASSRTTTEKSTSRGSRS